MHFEQGIALYTTGDYAAALAEFTESYRLRPVPGVFKNIAVAQQALFRYADAIESLTRYLQESPALTIEQRSEAERLIVEMRALLADVHVRVEPAGAAILVDQRLVGRAPLRAQLQLAAGPHTIEVTADGYHPQKRELNVVAGRSQALDIALVAIPRTGRVRVKVSVSRATVSVDGTPAGLAPLELELPPGGHTLEVSAKAHRIHRSELVVTAGQTRDVTITLDKVAAAKPWYRKWQVWTPVAAGTALLVTGLAIGLSQTEDPIAGTLSPGVGTIQ